MLFSQVFHVCENFIYKIKKNASISFMMDDENPFSLDHFHKIALHIKGLSFYCIKEITLIENW